MYQDKNKLVNEVTKIFDSLESLDDLKGVVDELIPEVEPYVERMRQYAVDVKGKSIKQLMDSYNFTFEEALETIGTMSTEAVKSVSDTMKK